MDETKAKIELMAECLDTERQYCIHLFALCSFKEGIKQQDDQNDYEKVFINFDRLFDISLSVEAELMDCLESFLKEKKEARGEKWVLKWDQKVTEGDDRSKKAIAMARKAQLLVERAQLEKNKEDISQNGCEEEGNQEEKKEKNGEEERNREKYGIGEIFLEHLPLLAKGILTYVIGMSSFHTHEHLKKISRSFTTTFSQETYTLDSLFCWPKGRGARYSLILSEYLRATLLSQREWVSLRCCVDGFRGWYTSPPIQFDMLLQIGEKKLVKKIKDFWECFLPEKKKAAEEEGLLSRFCPWPYSDPNPLSPEELSIQCSLLIGEAIAKEIFNFGGVLNELWSAALSFENKLKEEGKNVTSFCEIFLQFSSLFAELFSKWATCYIFLVNSFKETEQKRPSEEEKDYDVSLLSLKSFFSSIFKPLSRFVAYINALQLLSWSCDAIGKQKREKDQAILLKTLSFYQEIAENTVDCFGKLKKGRSIKRASSSS